MVNWVVRLKNPPGSISTSFWKCDAAARSGRDIGVGRSWLSGGTGLPGSSILFLVLP